MRVEGIAPRTWLLATVAAWAVVLWILAMSGMGGQVSRLPDDAGMLLRLPQLSPAPPERLGPLAQYAEIGTRPLFSEDRRPQPFSLTQEGDETAAPAFDFVLTSVLLTPTLKMAIVQPSAGGESIRIKLGEAAESQPSWRLTALNPRSAIFEGPDGRKSLDLRVFDGTGGEPPTALHGAADQAATPTATASPRPPATKPASPTQPRPTQPQPQPQPQPPTAGADTGADADATDADAGPNPEAQMESIRKRIEERRAQLRQESQTPATPAKNP